MYKMPPTVKKGKWKSQAFMENSTGIMPGMKMNISPIWRVSSFK